MANGIITQSNVKVEVHERVSKTPSSTDWEECYSYTAPVSGYYAIAATALYWSAPPNKGAAVMYNHHTPTEGDYNIAAISPSNSKGTASGIVYLEEGTTIYFYGSWSVANAGERFDVVLKRLN